MTDPIPIENWQEDIVSEETYRHIICKSFGVVGNSFDKWLCASFPIFYILLLIFTNVKNHLASYDEIINYIEDTFPIIIGAEASILGFLIAGFAILLSGSNIKILKFLAQFRDPSRDISEFKFVIFNFISVFINHVSLLGILIIFLFASNRLSPISFFLKQFSDYFPNLTSCVVSAVFVIVLSYILYCLLLIKSFILAVYQTTTLSIALSDEANTE